MIVPASRCFAGWRDVPDTCRGKPARGSEVARPTGFEPVAFGSGGRGKEATGGSVEPLPLIVLAFSHTRDHPPRPRAATDCQSIVRQTEDRTAEPSVAKIQQRTSATSPDRPLSIAMRAAGTQGRMSSIALLTALSTSTNNPES